MGGDVNLICPDLRKVAERVAAAEERISNLEDDMDGAQLNITKHQAVARTLEVSVE